MYLSMYLSVLSNNQYDIFYMQTYEIAIGHTMDSNNETIIIRRCSKSKDNSKVEFYVLLILNV